MDEHKTEHVLEYRTIHDLYNNIQVPYNLVIIDIRNYDIFQSSHIINAMNIPFSSSSINNSQSNTHLLTPEQISNLIQLKQESKTSVKRGMNYWLIQSEQQMKSLFTNDKQYKSFIHSLFNIIYECIHPSTTIYLLDVAYEHWSAKYSCFNVYQKEIESEEKLETKIETNAETNVDIETIAIGMKVETKEEDIQLNDNNIYELLSTIAKSKFTFYRRYPPSIIDDRIYLGNAGHSNNKRIFDTLGITHVVNCTSEERNVWKHNKNIHYLRVDLKDRMDADIAVHFETAIAFINEALDICADEDDENRRENTNTVLIHCQAGVSRSATITIAYLMAVKGMRFQIAYDFVKSKRCVVWPNPSFIVQLEKFDEELFGSDVSNGDNWKSKCIVL